MRSDISIRESVEVWIVGVRSQLARTHGLCSLPAERD